MNKIVLVAFVAFFTTGFLFPARIVRNGAFRNRISKCAPQLRLVSVRSDSEKKCPTTTKKRLCRKDYHEHFTYVLFDGEVDRLNSLFQSQRLHAMITQLVIYYASQDFMDDPRLVHLMAECFSSMTELVLENPAFDAFEEPAIIGELRQKGCRITYKFE